MAKSKRGFGSAAHREAAGHGLGTYHKAKNLKTRNIAALRKEYCAARNHADRVGRALGMVTGAHKKSPHRKRHVKCRTSR
jgi:hypothetical protein